MSENPKQNSLQTWSEGLADQNRDYASLTDEEKIYRFNELFNTFLDATLEVGDGLLTMPALLAKNFELIQDIPSGLIRIIGTNHFESFENLLDAMKVPRNKLLRHEEFYNYYPDVFMTPENQASMLAICYTRDQNPLLISTYNGKHTQFKLLSALFVNTNILNKKNHLEVAVILTNYVSYLSDFFALQQDIATGVKIDDGKVQYMAIPSITECIFERGRIRSEAVMGYLKDGESKVTEALPDFKELYKVQPDLGDQN